ncbi:2d69ee01-e847-4d23-9967-26728d1da4f2 [Sclerotinia trifoliorum]|uniref:2d69ee01-e847-4d23-9967-26728d1da4f2 n=1 Tax=Sclerotinia trifoliorum TaxID=28548 RepID=A0A8H2ZS02_9HELO|nr:2d69ee01-e847-4d23-9967-26728d1da4f2 [Sclerotinia trifoliorum]
MMGLTRSTLVVLFSLSLLLQPLANAQDQAQGRPGASAQAPAAGRPGASSSDQVPVQASASSQAPAAGRPGASTAPTTDPAQPRPKVYSCPADNGARYTTGNGVTFELKCDHGTIAKPLDNTITNTQKDCADYCSTLSNCQSCDWNINSKLCATKQQYIPTFPLPGTHTWFPLEERSQRPETEYRSPPDCPAAKVALLESVTTSATFTADGECPSNDGKIFLTPQGTYFQVKCGTQNTAQVTLPDSRPLHDFAECMTACADNPECNSVTFASGKPDWQCKMFESGVETLAADATKNKASAVVIEPPTSAKKDDLVYLCSTECPNADGQTWDSPTGQKFRMDCCKRHGTITIGQTQAGSLEECMKICSFTLACQSVDFQRDTGRCYFGKHSGAPTIAASGWASAYAVGCSGACKKEGCCGGA